MRTRDILPIADNFDPGDIKGWNSGWAFPIAEVLYVHGHNVPDSWEFRPSPALRCPADLDTDDWYTEEVITALETYGPDALIYIGNVLERYYRLFIAGTDHDY